MVKNNIDNKGLKSDNNKSRMRIFYLAHFSAGDNTYYCSPAAVSKLEYIFSKIEEMGLCLNVISEAYAENGGLHCRKTKSYKRYKVVLFFSIGVPTGIVRFINSRFVLLQVFLYLLFHVGKNDTLIDYHSTNNMSMLYMAKRIKKFRLIEEIEEIYGDVNNDEKLRKKEHKYSRYADGFMFPTELLNYKLNLLHKPYTVIHGIYQSEFDRNVKFDDDKIHVVYAGTLAAKKGGALAAAAAEFLEDNYHLHILGFGSNKEIDEIKALIKHINEISKATVSYDGVKRDEEYIRFIQCCDIGLSTQNPDAEFNDTSFPSKILSYMSNGLHVVSIRIKAVEESQVGKYIHYYDIQTPAEIANAILTVDLSDGYDAGMIMKTLDLKFKNELKILLG